MSVHSTPPGVHIVRPIAPSHQSYHRIRDGINPPLSQPEGLYSSSVFDAYDAHERWTELRDLSSSEPQASDTKQLLEPYARRSSTSSSSSSTSTASRQTWAERWLTSMDAALTAFWTLPVVCYVIWPFQRVDSAIACLVARSRFQGWRMGLLLGCCISSVVLCINMTVLILIANRGDGFEGGFAVPWTGLSEDMSRYSSAIHVAINALSTVLLAASNYTMQVLSSPTRKDIDKAHARNEHLDVGFLSTRNLSRIPKRRLLLFLIMGLSSVPIHLFYNSAIFYIGANNEYDIHVVEAGSDLHRTDYEANTPAQYDKIVGSKWISMYDNAFVSSGTLILAVDEYRSEINNVTQNGKPPDWPNVDSNTTITWNAGVVAWTFRDLVTKQLSDRSFLKAVTDTKSASKDWIKLAWMISEVEKDPLHGSTNAPPSFARVSHVFVQKIGAKGSRIQASLTFLVIVISCNFVKLLTMLWVVFMERKHYIVTLGDGAASFLEHCDPTTKRMCMLSKPEITREVAADSFKHNDQLERLVMDARMTWAERSITYSNARNKDREVGTYFLFAVNVALFGIFITTAVISRTSREWGSSSVTTFRETDSSAQETLLNAWLSNAPQLILSFCYLAINSECTAMAGAAEWNNLASSHKGLRVTKPVGKQRDTYFLQLPYRWALPLMIASGGLHWLLSQSIFLVRVDVYDREGNLKQGNDAKSACGFSGTSWMTLTGCFWLLVGIVVFIGHKKIRMKLPFAASCSLVISAACHPPRGDEGAHLKPLKWGVVDERIIEGNLHCSLSSGRVKRPKAGVKYL